jgi:hypothetical protein
MEAQPITPQQIVGIVIGVAALLAIIMMAVIQYTAAKVKGNPGPWKFNPAEYPFVLQSTDLTDISKKAFTLSNYLYIEGATEQRSNPHDIWRWGKTDPILNSYASVVASYVPAEEKLRLVFANASTGDMNRETFLDIPGISPLRWYHCAITIEGRSVDIYINGKHVKSAQLPNVLKQTTDGIQLVGNSGILGSMALWDITEGRLNETQVNYRYKNTSDTLGQPLIPIDYSFNMANFKPTLCPGMPWCEEVKSKCNTYVKYQYA